MSDNLSSGEETAGPQWSPEVTGRYDQTLATANAEVLRLVHVLQIRAAEAGEIQAMADVVALLKHNFSQQALTGLLAAAVRQLARTRQGQPDGLQAAVDRVEIEALRGDFTDAVMMRDRTRLASLFTEDGVLRMPDVPVEQAGREEILAGGERLQAQWEFFVQTTHPGTIQLDGDTATGRAYIQELVRTRDSRQGLNYAIYHDRYRRTPDGWKFTERVYEIRYLDTSPLAGSAPSSASVGRDEA